MSTLTESDDARRECCRTVADTSAARLTRELAEARADSDEAHAILSRLSDLLTRTVNVLRGDPPPLVMWSWHDIPDLAAQRVAAIARVEAICGHAEQAGASPWIHATTIRQALEAPRG